MEERHMAKYRQHLPQLGDRPFLSDGGIETTLIFHEGFQLPDFAAFTLLKTDEGRDALRKYFRTYAELARRFDTGLVLESATWRASPDWGTRLGYTSEAVADANRSAIRLLESIRAEYETEQSPIVISGCIGPRGDGYIADNAMSAEAAAVYHGAQIDTFAASAADMVCAATMNYMEEAEGVVRAARGAGIPAAILFTVETDGKLPTGQPLADAINRVDDSTSGYASYFGINCAHPSHFEQVLSGGGAWTSRIRALRANASCRSHQELNDSPEIDIGNPAELGRDYARLKKQLPLLTVMGGCCGTDHRHIEQIAATCLPLFPAAAG
jgi:homocysteine S-methyltransferase